MFGYFEIYEPQLSSASATTVQAHLRIADGKTGDIKKDFGNIDATPYINAGSTVIPVGRETPFQSLPNGSYRLEVQAIDSAGQTTPWHTAAFIVEQIAAPYAAAIVAQASTNNSCLIEWPCQLPEKVMHGRTVQGKLVLGYPPDAESQDPSVVRIRVGVNAYGDATTMKVLSGDKALVKDAKTFLVKTKFPEAPKPDAVALSDPDNPPSYSDTFMPGGIRFQVYDVVFSAPPAKAKP